MERSDERKALLEQLLTAVNQCQLLYGHKKVLVTEKNEVVSIVFSSLEQIFSHGITSHANTPPKKVTISKLTQVFSFTQLSQSPPDFWPIIKQVLSKQEVERWQGKEGEKRGWWRGWLRGALNEHSLEKYLLKLSSSDQLLTDNYEPWAFMRDVEKVVALPNLAAGLSTVIFAVDIDVVALSQDDCPDALNKPAVDEKEVEGGNVGRSGGRNDGGMAIDKFKTTDVTRRRRKKRAKLVEIGGDDDDAKSASTTLSLESDVSLGNNISNNNPYNNRDTYSDSNVLINNSSLRTSLLKTGSGLLTDFKSSTAHAQLPSSGVIEQQATKPPPTHHAVKNPFSKVKTHRQTRSLHILPESSSFLPISPLAAERMEVVGGRGASLDGKEGMVRCLKEGTLGGVGGEAGIGGVCELLCGIKVEASEHLPPSSASSTTVATTHHSNPHLKNTFHNNLNSNNSCQMEQSHNNITSTPIESLLTTDTTPPATNNSLNSEKQTPLFHISSVPHLSTSILSLSPTTINPPTTIYPSTTTQPHTPTSDQPPINPLPPASFLHDNPFKHHLFSSPSRTSKCHSRCYSNNDVDFKSIYDDISDDDDDLAVKGDVISLNSNNSNNNNTSVENHLSTTNLIDFSCNQDASSESYGSFDSEEPAYMEMLKEASAPADALLSLLDADASYIPDRDEVRQALSSVISSKNNLLTEFRQVREQLRQREEVIEALRSKQLHEQQVCKLSKGLFTATTATNDDNQAASKHYQDKLLQLSEMHGDLMELNNHLLHRLFGKDKRIRVLERQLSFFKRFAPAEEVRYICQSKANVTIPQAVLCGTPHRPFHAYLVSVKVKEQEWSVQRRYAHFHALHTSFAQKFAIVHSFKFPPKKTFGKNDPKVVEARRKELEEYLRKLLALIVNTTPCLCNSLDKQTLVSTVPFFSPDSPTPKRKSSLPQLATTSNNDPPTTFTT